MRRWMVMGVLCACSASAPVSIDDLAAQRLDSICAFHVKCGEVNDMATCRSMFQPLALPSTVRAAVTAGRIKYDGELARECLDAIGSRSCNVTTVSYHGYPEACLAMFQGSLRSGATCAANEECISQSCAMPTCNMACCAGTCQGDDPPVLAKVGASCATNFCVPDAFCDPTSMMCVALQRLGEACDPEGPAFSCADGLYCLSSSRRCGPLPGPDERCDEDGCGDLGTHCSSTTGRCIPEGLPGDPCSESGDCSRLYRCGADHRCSAGIALGEPCTMFSQCAGPSAFCDIPDNAAMGVCTAPKANGAPCHAHSECTSYVCDPASKTCVADMPCD